MASNIERIAKEMSDLAASTVQVRVALSEKTTDEARIFVAWLSSEIPKEIAILLCQEWARLIRTVLSDRSDGWSSAISVISHWGPRLGVYCIGWAGHEDVWVEDDGSDPGYDSAWEILHQRLEDYLGVHGTSDSQGGGDYFLFDEMSGYLDQSLTIYRIEFLTPELVSGIQDILSDGYADWSVYVVLDLIPPIDEIGSDGIQIFMDRIIEKWDRDLLTKRLGKRLKL